MRLLGPAIALKSTSEIKTARRDLAKGDIRLVLVRGQGLDQRSLSHIELSHTVL
jgi:hypothetical protein